MTIYQLQLPARLYVAIFYAANSRLSTEELVELFGSPPWNFLGPDEGRYMSRSSELQKETPLTREGTIRTKKSGGSEEQRLIICASKREFGPGSACFIRPYEEYAEVLSKFQKRYPKIFEIGFRNENPLLQVGGWCFEENSGSFSLILESYSGYQAVWSVARRKYAKFEDLKQNLVLNVLRRRPKDIKTENSEVTSQYDLKWSVKIVSVTPLNLKMTANTAKLVTTNVNRTE